ncbi:MAG: S8 family peptidase [Pseudomonadota bacterium]
MEDDPLALLQARALRLLEELLINFAATDSMSYLTDTPIRPTVWRVFAAAPEKAVNLLIETNQYIRGADALKELSDGLSAVRRETSGVSEIGTADSKYMDQLRHSPSELPDNDPFQPTVTSHVFASIGNTIVARLDMDAMVQLVLPKTVWFQQLETPEVNAFLQFVQEAAGEGDLRDLQKTIAKSKRPALWRFLVTWVMIRDGHVAYLDRARALVDERDGVDADTSEDGIADALRDDALRRAAEEARWRHIAEKSQLLLRVSSPEFQWDTGTENAKQVNAHVRAFFLTLMETYGTALHWLANEAKKTTREDAKRAPVWSVDLNRVATLATHHSRKTVKVDAAENVFHISTKGITWAILDSGIDATHPAFMDRDQDLPKNLSEDRQAFYRTRIRGTYDFTRLTKLVSENYADMLETTDEKSAAIAFDDGKTDKLGNPTPRGVISYLYATFELSKNTMSRGARARVSGANLEKKIKSEKFFERVKEQFGQIKRNMIEGRQLDWPLLEPILHVGHVPEFYVVPTNGHGTHVAGILAGDVSDPEDLAAMHLEQPAKGMCPDIKLVDMRVCDRFGQSNEYIVMAAMQFIAYLNRTRDVPVIQGANLSLQIAHEVRNYGCGQTPICKEANRLVDAGVCVVVAAGNQGFRTVQSDIGFVPSYAASSIMDPGNADKVITVGSTHRSSPHLNGVSYFSSRGPTADGREKPDILAPGEKILAPSPEKEMREDSGTSMACPHVSGAAAQILARHEEFIGRPLAVKKVLMDSATDLNRRPEFQGAGLLDVLRALESI